VYATVLYSLLQIYENGDKMSNKTSLALASVLTIILIGCHNACYEKYKQYAEECGKSYTSCCDVKTCPGYSRFSTLQRNPKMSNEQGNPAIPARDLRRSIVLDLV